MGEPTTCPKCGKNLALVGTRHQCSPISTIGPSISAEPIRSPSLRAQQHPSSTTYQYRDIEKRRAYQRAYQKARRAKAAAERASPRG